MRSHRPRVTVALLERFLRDNGPLTGDLLEECRTRSDLWLWRQVLCALVVRTMTRLRGNPRATIEAVLVAMAMLVLLSFQAVVVATLMSHLLVLLDGAARAPAWIPPTGRYEVWQIWFTVSSFAVAVVTGRAIGCLHSARRGAAVLSASVSATAAAFLNLNLFVPNALAQSFVPNAALQTAFMMVFIAGLFAGAGSRLACQTSPSA